MGTTRQKISQRSIIFVSEVVGSSSILLVKMMVITRMMVRFTARTYPSNFLSKKMETKLMKSRRLVGRKVVNSSLETCLLSFKLM